MQRLPLFQQHVVGHVDHRRNRAQPGTLELAAHPVRRGGTGIDVTDHPADVARAGGRRGQRDLTAFVDERLHGGNCRLVEGGSGQCGHFAGYAAQAQAVRPVRSDLEFD